MICGVYFYVMCDYSRFRSAAAADEEEEEDVSCSPTPQSDPIGPFPFQ